MRTGDVESSQAIRTAPGWKHEHSTSVETRHALAEAAVVVDADRYGADHVAVLAVSHAHCEDLADRIRTIRIARGERRGSVLRGPGGGLQARNCAAGDRILIHADLDPRSAAGVSNGTTGTILPMAPRHLFATGSDSGHWPPVTHRRYIPLPGGSGSVACEHDEKVRRCAEASALRLRVEPSS